MRLIRLQLGLLAAASFTLSSNLGCETKGAVDDHESDKDTDRARSDDDDSVRKDDDKADVDDDAKSDAKDDRPATSTPRATPDAGKVKSVDAATPDAGPAKPPVTKPNDGMRAVVMVGNSVSGTVSFIDAESFENLGSVNVVPDREATVSAIESDPIRAITYAAVKSGQLIHHHEPSGGDRFVDDLFVSPSGQTLYVSRSNLADVAAFDLTKAGHPLRWKTRVQGAKADHASISPDGKQLVVSATSARIAEVFDAETGKQVGSFSTGETPHQNDYSADGMFIYNSSIGNVAYESVPYEQNERKGDRWLVRADAQTFKVVRTWRFDYAIRPSVITDSDKIMYAQLSYLNGVIKYDLEAEKELARSDQPLSQAALDTYKSHNEYPHDSAHHGLALSGDGKKLCDCGTIDNDVAIVTTSDMKAVKRIDVGLVPYWATITPDGTHCAVSLSGGDAISIIDLSAEEEVTVVKVGKFPQRSRLGKIPETVVGLLVNSDG